MAISPDHRPDDARNPPHSAPSPNWYRRHHLHVPWTVSLSRDLAEGGIDLVAGHARIDQGQGAHRTLDSLRHAGAGGKNRRSFKASQQPRGRGRKWNFRCLLILSLWPRDAEKMGEALE